MKVRRTPDERFAGLPGYPFAPHYVDVPAGDDDDPVGDSTVRLHYVDEGPAGAAETVVLLHGEPIWSYLYRTSDPAARRRRPPGRRPGPRRLRAVRQAGRPRRAHLRPPRRVAARGALRPPRPRPGSPCSARTGAGSSASGSSPSTPTGSRRVAVGNTGLPTGDERPTDAFLAWQQYSQDAPSASTSARSSTPARCATALDETSIAAYDAPFPDDTYKEGAAPVPVARADDARRPGVGDNRAAWDGARARSTEPFLCCSRDGDPITRGADRRFRELVPGAKGQAHVTIEGAGHFLQEDKGPDLAAMVLSFVAGTAAD